MSCEHQEYKNIEIHFTKGWKQYALGNCVDCPVTCILISRDTPFSKWKRFYCFHLENVKVDSNIEWKEEKYIHYFKKTGMEIYLGGNQRLLSKMPTNHPTLCAI